MQSTICPVDFLHELVSTDTKMQKLCTIVCHLQISVVDSTVYYLSCLKCCQFIFIVDSTICYLLSIFLPSMISLPLIVDSTVDYLSSCNVMNFYHSR